ncbi:hypothetical protein BDW71DRAFT_170756 [Aspergillus fruticulosus]
MERGRQLSKRPEQRRNWLKEMIAPYHQTLDNVFKLEDDWSQWGIALFRAGTYGAKHEERWKGFQQRWDLIFEREFAS